ncbi:MAG TPA: hypothetical protein VGP61_10315, partial [Gemmatimonadales bacterium]|nr:hypothetical protein [Gemmatimonadales bacterium]
MPSAERDLSDASRRELLLVAVLTALLAVSFALLAAPEFRFVGDTEHYVELAGAVAHGTAYAVNGRPEVLVPPGLPLLLAPAARFFHG